MYERQLKYLNLILKNGRTPHAFLFYGRDAAFQKETAKNFLAGLNGPEFGASIKSENHPDVLFVRPEEGKKDISVAQVAGVRRFAAQTPLALAVKGIVMEEAQRLNEEGWNALLKTLEEPPPDTMFFLLAASVKNIPRTVSSRAMAVPFTGFSAKRAGPKDDIIINKLVGLEKLSLLERFDLAEEISRRENIAEILDAWMLEARSRLLEDHDKRSAALLEKVAGLKDRITTTNVNARLALENLFLRF